HELRFSKSSAYRRSTAARLLVKLPSMGPLLRSGELTLVTLCLLKDVLAGGEAESILERARGKSEEEVEVLVATLRPKEPTRDSFRLLPVSAPQARSKNDEMSFMKGPPKEEPCQKPAKLVPISEELRILKVTVDHAFVEDLEKVKDALSHKV